MRPGAAQFVVGLDVFDERYERRIAPQILDLLRPSAGSIGHHFPGGKEQLALDVVVAASNSTSDLIDAPLGTDEEPVEMMRQWIVASARVLQPSGYANGCPLATMALELAHRSDVVQQQIAAGYDSWVGLLADRLAPAHGDGAHDTAGLLHCELRETSAE